MVYMFPMSFDNKKSVDELPAATPNNNNYNINTVTGFYDKFGLHRRFIAAFSV